MDINELKKIAHLVGGACAHTMCEDCDFRVKVTGKPYACGIDEGAAIVEAVRIIEDLEKRISSMREPTKRIWYPKSRSWECEGCGDVVRGIDKFCPNCGRRFDGEKDEEGGDLDV